MLTTKTLTHEERLQELNDAHAKAVRQLELRRDVLAMLPDTLPRPTISNEDSSYFGTPAVWLSWRASLYGEQPRVGSDILAALEASGFAPMAVTACKWDDWRVKAEPGAQEAIPDTKGRYTLKDTTPIAPLWIEPNNHTPPEARTYYQKDGRIYLVTVPAPSTACLYARRIERLGDWSYESGSARLRYPDEWHAIRQPNGDSVAGISQLSRAYRDTEQGLSGAIYFEPYTEQEAFPLTPSALLRVLEAPATA